MKLHASLLFLGFLAITTSAQEKKTYHIRTIAFYNVENLFDVVNDSLNFDDARTPHGKYHWNRERYLHKIAHISKVLSSVGSKINKNSPAIIGLCEVENRAVVQDLILHPNLKNKGYASIHFDAPDERGIDVALLYKKDVFQPISFKSHRLLLFDVEGNRDYTRDQLVVGGVLDNDFFYFIVNHWPSRSGGEIRSRPHRIAAAQLNRRIIDSLTKLDPTAKIMSMGDLNDDPVDDSLKKVLKTKGTPHQLEFNELYNPMEQLFKKGQGSLAYRDQWNLFDQIFFTSNLILSENGYRYWKAGVYAPSYLLTQQGKYKGYPLRTYSGTTYTGGYSDHFPVYVHLIRETDQNH